METRIFDTDTIAQTAIKIFESFEVNQSCTIAGFKMVDDNAVPRGELIIAKIKEYDEKLNFDTTYSGKRRRKRSIPANSIGGYLAQKIFKWSIDERESGVVYTIWRIQ